MLHASDLLAAIHAAPDDDAPRLVYADWLSEQGDPRGELIAMMVKLARSEADDVELEDRTGVMQRIVLALQAFGRRWVEPIEAIARARYRFTRGFVEQVAAYEGPPLHVVIDALRAAGAVLRHAVVRPQEIEPLLATPASATFAKVELLQPNIDAHELDVLSKSLRGMRALDLDRPITTAWRALAEWPHELDHLGVTFGMGGERVTPFVEWVTAARPKLRSLRLFGAVPSGDLPVHGGLAHLALSARRIDVGLIRSIGRAYPNLRRLTLRDTSIGDAAIKELCASKLALRRLECRDAPLTRVGRQAISARFGPVLW